MKKEKSCGAVVFTLINGCPQYVLVRNKQGVYGFPKGHVEGNESERATAVREIFEETRLTVRFLDGFRMEESYVPPNLGIVKDVVYFLGYFENQTPVPQEEELSGLVLVPYEEAMELFLFESYRRILTKANAYIKQNFY